MNFQIHYINFSKKNIIYKFLKYYVLIKRLKNTYFNKITKLVEHFNLPKTRGLSDVKFQFFLGSLRKL